MHRNINAITVNWHAKHFPKSHSLESFLNADSELIEIGKAVASRTNFGANCANF
jgi:hypothetical protein